MLYLEAEVKAMMMLLFAVKDNMYVSTRTRKYEDKQHVHI